MLRLSLQTHEQLLAKSSGVISSLYSGGNIDKQHHTIDSQQIFGTLLDYCCACSPTRREDLIGERCSGCGIEYLPAITRRKRTAHIELPLPIIHPLFLGEVRKLSGMPAQDFNSAIMGREFFSFIGGTLAIGGSPSDSISCLYRFISDLDDVDGHDVSVIMLSIIPVSAPITRLDSEHADNAFNVIYRSIIQASTAWRNAAEQPHHIASHTQCRLFGRLQHIVSYLYDSNVSSALTKKRQPLFSGGGAAKQLDHIGILNGMGAKTGTIRGTMLGKRVDFSARAMHGGLRCPDIDTAIVPYRILAELLTPHIMNILYTQTDYMTRYEVRQAVKYMYDIVLDVVDDICGAYLFLFNRAPTLHKAGIIALRVQPTTMNSVHLPHLTYSGLCLDSDGDQLAIHLPISNEAQAEAEALMLPSNNLFRQRDGEFAYYPAHECLMGLKYATMLGEHNPKNKGVFNSSESVKKALDVGAVCLMDRISLKEIGQAIVVTTVARVIIGEALNCTVIKRMDTDYGKQLLTAATEQRVVDMKAALALLEEIGYDVMHSVGFSICVDDFAQTDDTKKCVIGMQTMSDEQQREAITTLEQKLKSNHKA